ncbi:DUF7563 family protein [Halorubrum pallidum]
MNRLHGGSGDADRCLYCNRHVSETFQSVFGDEHDRAHRCLGCDCFRRVSLGSAGSVSVDNTSEQSDHCDRGQRYRLVTRDFHFGGHDRRE